MIPIDIDWQSFSKNWRFSCRFVLSPWGNYRELTVVFILINGYFGYKSSFLHVMIVSFY